MLTLVHMTGDKTADGHKIGLYACACGNRKAISATRVRNGYTTSCGCFRPDNSTHGMRYSPEYSSWQAMKGRCLDRDNKDYPRWGGSGVTICAEWVESFEAFYEHIGPRPNGTTLDRIENTKGYQPGNVRWATLSEQAANRRDTWIVEIDGIQHPSVEEAARAHGVSTTTIVRWCDGFTDARRAHQIDQGKKSSRPGCRRWRKYAR